MEASLLAERGRMGEAELAIEAAIAADGEPAALWAALGTARCERSWDEAAPHFERALEQAPGLAQVWDRLAQCQERHGLTAQALESARRAAALAPDDIAVNLHPAELLERRGQSEAAERWLTALVLRAPDRRPYASALQAFQTRHRGATGGKSLPGPRMIAPAPAPGATDAVSAQALRAWRDQDHARAFALATLALAADPNDRNALALVLVTSSDPWNSIPRLLESTPTGQLAPDLRVEVARLIADPRGPAQAASPPPSETADGSTVPGESTGTTRR